jgi:hypothetical protein
VLETCEGLGGLAEIGEMRHDFEGSRSLRRRTGPKACHHPPEPVRGPFSSLGVACSQAPANFPYHMAGFRPENRQKLGQERSIVVDELEQLSRIKRWNHSCLSMQYHFVTITVRGFQTSTASRACRADLFRLRTGD